MRRNQKTTIAAMPPTKKAMRQPKSDTWALEKIPSSTSSMNWASTWPPTSVTYWNEEKKPRRSRVAASDMYVALVPYSPPVAKPCTRRHRTRITAAAMPIVSRPGTIAMMNEHAAISETLMVNAARLPFRSAYRPKNHEPTGRMTKVTAKIA